MHKRILSFIFFLLPCVLIAQTFSIKGTVTNAETKQPVAGAVVFINYSSKASVTDSIGNFIINDVTEKYCDLIVHKQGYENIEYRFSYQPNARSIHFLVLQRSKDSSFIQSDDLIDKNLQKWSSFFMQNFVGLSLNANECVLTNPKALRFYYDSASASFAANATEPLLVFNEGLGYMINYVLDEFIIKSNGETYLRGYAWYKNLSSKNPEVLKKWQQRRMDAFYGSALHFMRSLYQNKIEEEGFEIRDVMKLYDDDPLYVSGLNKKNIKTGTESIKTPDGKIIDKNYVEWVEKNKISADYFFNYDSLQQCFYLRTNHVLQVTYKKGIEDYAYTIRNNSNGSYPVSYIVVKNDEHKIRIENNGAYYDIWDLIKDGYWRWLKLGDQLPIDFGEK